VVIQKQISYLSTCTAAAQSGSWRRKAVGVGCQLTCYVYLDTFHKVNKLQSPDHIWHFYHLDIDFGHGKLTRSAMKIKRQSQLTLPFMFSG
jgi:hypothetical protein